MASKADKAAKASGMVEYAPGKWATPQSLIDNPDMKAQADALAAKRASDAKDYAANASARVDAGEPVNAADLLIAGGEKAAAAGAAAAQETKDAKVTPDTFGVTLTELARARTQLQMMATNGRAGSVLGIGTDSYTPDITPRGITGNKRLDARDRNVRTDAMRNKDPRFQSAFNLPFMNASKGRLL